jgi:hypothetical protein
MLNSKRFDLFFQRFFSLVSIVMMLILVSCLPQSSTSPKLNTNSSTGDGTTTPTVIYSEPTYPLTGIFVQQGATQSNTNLSLPLNFSDSFLIRGTTLSQYLKTLPNTTAFCLVGDYKYNVGKNKFLILSGKAKSYTDLINKTTEFYLQVEPSNDQSNQNDCLTYNLTNSLFSGVALPSASFSLTQLCTDCSSSVTSNGLKLYFVSGQEVSTLNFSAIQLTISGSTSSVGSTCSESTACTARGFDCCLDSACVKDGSVKPSALTDPGFTSAQQDVASNPNRFIVYPQYYNVCTTRPGSVGGSTGGSTGDPNYQATIRLQELNQLYQCINKVDGEFSYCTTKFLSAQGNIKAGIAFTAGTDDINFTTLNPNFSIGDYANTIVKITYAGLTLFEENKTPLAPTDGSWVNSGNDDLVAAQSVKIIRTPPTNAQDDNLYLTYKIDGTCDQSGSTIAKCVKTYIFMSSDLTNTTFHDSTKTFKLPSYADLTSSMSLIVKISGVIIPEDPSTWSRQLFPNRIVFNPAYPIYQNQTVEIDYFVTSGITNLLKSKIAAQAQVNSMCTCAGSDKCNLRAIYDTNNILSNYECVYPSVASSAPPANQTVYVSNKNIPHRYFDVNGVSYDDNYSTAPAQELVPFSYTTANPLKPSNVGVYTGFNEIYGSFSTTDSQAARPAKLVTIKKDTNYDIYVNSGAFSSCLNCGTDYYTSLQKIFPQNFAGKGGGYTPDLYESRRENNASIYRSDDLLYGRACFVPATMIPWTHVASTSPKDQRQARLSGQHFLFANGYNRDWFGFDYGSLIGSFDGVSWFSIGNARRIKATTSKLFLAVNAYYGDLNIDNSFNVTVSESSSYSTAIPDHDTKSDGAECQKSHYCSNDNDCIRQLGYDYTCQNITSLTSNWPMFDAAGSEVVGSTNKTIASILGGSNGQAKRCMYRGRGAPCHNNLLSTSNTFNGSGITGSLSCSPNNSCQSFTGTYPTRFNDRIARFAGSPSAQNIASAASTLSDIVGLGARIIGRPFDYYGNQSVPALSLSNLTQNQVNAVCIPGKDLSNSNRTFDLNMLSPSNRIETSDKILGIGTTLASQDPKLLNACPATDSTGTLIQQTDQPLGSSVINTYSITQNLSSNLMDLPPLAALNIFSSTANSQISSVGYQRNSCLRAPGASCFTDMDCAPSNFIASKARTTSLASYVNSAEEMFWKEDLICGNPDFKVVNSGALNPNYDLKKNFCCRDIAKTISVFTQTDTSDYTWCDSGTNTLSVAGVNKSLNSFSRYSRVHTNYDQMTCVASTVGATNPYALSIAAANTNDRFSQIQYQFKTLDAINQKTCCTQNWVRSFGDGGHTWGKGKTQNIDKTIWKNVSWYADNSLLTLPSGDPDGIFDCSGTANNYANATCEIRNFVSTDDDLYLNWAASLELIGIPQVAIKTNDLVHQIVDDNQADNFAAKVPLNNTVNPVSVWGADFSSGTDTYYSGSSYTKFSPTLKKSFSENEFNCCLPSGKQVPDSTTASQCCTGYIANTGSSTALRCCLPGYTDVSLYLNRYVSSEGRGLTDSSYDPLTGYIKDSGVVQLLQAQKSLCCSGKAVLGYAISKLPKPVDGAYLDPTTPNSTTRRFVHRTDVIDNNPQTGGIADRYDSGIRWNNHLYCVPANYVEPPKLGLR